MMDKLYITLEADRLAVAAILVKSKYTVRSGSEKRPGSKSYDYFLEFERNPEITTARKGVAIGEG